MGEKLVLLLLKVFILVTTPLTLLIGIFLVFDFDTYSKVERFLSKTYLAHKKTWLAWLFKSRNSLHLFLISHRRLFGIICILDAVGICVLFNFYLFKKV